MIGKLIAMMARTQIPFPGHLVFASALYLHLSIN